MSVPKSESAALLAERRSFFWYFAERQVCGRPVHHQHHAACVRDLDHGPEIECDGYYEPTVEERIALWRAAQGEPYVCPPCARGEHHACSEPGVCRCTIHPDTGEDEGDDTQGASDA